MGQEVSVVNNFLFPATNSSYTAEQFAHHLAWLPVEGTPDPAVVLLLPYPHARYTILYMHGNGEDLGLIHAFIEVLQSRFQVSFCCVEYPGYGVADGSANELSVNRVVETAFQFLTKTLKIPEETIVIMGRSIGTGPSIACAVRHSNVAGLICMSAFSSISDMVDKVAGNFVSIFVSNRFDSIGIISKVKCPVLFLHGKADEIIPYTHSERLFATCTSSRFLCIRENMTHNRFILEKDVLDPISNFFDFSGEPSPLWELPPEIFIHPSRRGTADSPVTVSSASSLSMASAASGNAVASAASSSIRNTRSFLDSYGFPTANQVSRTSVPAAPAGTGASAAANLIAVQSAQSTPAPQPSKALPASSKLTPVSGTSASGAANLPNLSAGNAKHHGHHGHHGHNRSASSGNASTSTSTSSSSSTTAASGPLGHLLPYASTPSTAIGWKPAVSSSTPTSALTAPIVAVVGSKQRAASLLAEAELSKRQ